MDVGDDWQDGDEGLAVDEAPEGVDEGLEVEEAMEAQEVQILALNVPGDLPHIHTNILNQTLSKKKTLFLRIVARSAGRTARVHFPKHLLRRPHSHRTGVAESPGKVHLRLLY